MIPASVRHLVVEGNYLLLKAAPWSMLHGLFDTTVMIDVPEPVLHARLLRRWEGYGFGPKEAREKAEGNDLRNGRLVMTESIEAEFITAGTRG